MGNGRSDDQGADHAARRSSSLLDQIVRDGARQMLAAALQAELAADIDAHADQLVSTAMRGPVVPTAGLLGNAALGTTTAVLQPAIVVQHRPPAQDSTR